MALSPEQFETQEFKTAFRGWDRHEVTAFLKRAATEMRELHGRLDSAQAEVEEAHRSKEAAIAAAAQLPVPPALTTTSDQEDADKFNELGDRIAGLLRTAEESADKIRDEADVEAQELRAKVELEVEELKAEAEELLEKAKADAEQIRADAEEETKKSKSEIEEARANLDAELAETRKEAEADRKQAKKELAEAQAEVAQLLAEARSQSEFIRQEADEIVRVKVRTDMETAEKRMRILQLTEQSSRERLVAAQAELTAALDKLENEPSPELASVEADSILEEAHDRAAAELDAAPVEKDEPKPFVGNSLDEVFEPQFYENPDPVVSDDEDDDASAVLDLDDVIEVEEEDESVGSKYEEAYGFSSGDEDETLDLSDDADDDHADDDVVLEDEDDDADFSISDDADEAVAGAEEELEVDDVADELEVEDNDEVEIDDVEMDADDDHDDAFDAQAVMDETPGVIIEDSISSLPTDSQSPLDAVEVPNDSGELLDDELVNSVSSAPAESADAVPPALAGKQGSNAGSVDAEPKVLADEDPLAKLVREAMQRAVDSARGDEL